MTTGEKRQSSITNTVRVKPKRLGKVRLGLGGIGQAAIDRVHVMVNMIRIAKGKDPIDFDLPSSKPRTWRRAVPKPGTDTVQTFPEDNYVAPCLSGVTKEHEATEELHEPVVC